MRHFPNIIGCLIVLGTCLKAETVPVGDLDAKIVPEQVATLSFQTKGIVSDLHVDTSQRVEKGTVIAVMDKEKTQQEREDMELQIRRERLTKKDEIRKLEQQREKLNFYLSLNEEERNYARELRPEGEASQASVADINERIELNKLELNTIERRKRMDFDMKHEPLTMRMPFTGRLQYHFPMPEHPERPFEYVQNPAIPFATVCDDSAFYITVSLTDTDLSLMQPESFSVAVRLPAGQRLTGTFAFRRVERGGNRGDMLVYFFKIPQQAHDTAFQMLGSSTTATLYYTTDGGCKRVSKAELLTHPSAPDCQDWRELAQLVYPDHVVMLITERDVIMRPQSATPASEP